jgi:uncharacterized membrane protein
MAFCAKCGTALNEGSSFCVNCGQPTGPATSSSTSTTATLPITQVATNAGAGITSNMAAALSYILGFISGAVFLALEPYKNDRFVRFHAMQSIFYSASCIVFSIGWRIMWTIVGEMSGFVYVVLIPVRMLIGLAMFLFWLFLMYQAYNQREFRIPIIGPIAARQVGGASKITA